MNGCVKSEALGELESEDVVKNYSSESDDDEKLFVDVKTGSAARRPRKSTALRKNIARVLVDSELQADTLEARHEEEERRRRLHLQRSLHAVDGPQGSKDLDGGAVLSDSCLEQSDEETLERDVIVLESSDDEQSFVPPKKKSRPLSAVDIIQIDSASSGDESTLGKSDNEGEEEDVDVTRRKTADGRVLVNVNRPVGEEEIFLAPQIARVVKPHQISGIHFLYDNLVESVGRFKDSRGFGCILAHSMGLGKTLQVIAFIDIFLRHTSAKRVLCVVPINTLQNWAREFDIWLPKNLQESDNQKAFASGSVLFRRFKVFLLSELERSLPARASIISDWYNHGGVLLVGYELFRTLSTMQPSVEGRRRLAQLESGSVRRNKKKPNGTNGGNAAEGMQVIDVDEEDRQTELLEGLQAALCNPGPDLVVCDEGHRIKNNHAAISQALHQIRTRRRVVLTGYPLQNNLMEYWCMVDFVRPNYLGSRQEFSNMFERPILNGQCVDSTLKDFKLMRYRSHVLHNLLKGFVQRRSEKILNKALPGKHEWVLFVRMSPLQQRLYSLTLEMVKGESSSGYTSINPIRAFSACCKVWNHPDVLYTALTTTKTNKGVIHDLDIETSSSGNSKSSWKPAAEQTMLANWSPIYMPLFHNYSTLNPMNSGKIVIVLKLIEQSVVAGDRILVFSQSLLTLSLIEEFLSHEKVPGIGGQETSGEKWCRNVSYFRLDGSTPSLDRERLIDNFNSSSNKSTWLFLLSTRAGGLGVNLVNANRVVLMDVSWNPCHDVQAICRIYRYGQQKPCYVYRLVQDGTMERKVYERQVSKQNMADRVVDELQPERNFTRDEVFQLFEVQDIPEPVEMADAIPNYQDTAVASVLAYHSLWLTRVPFEHSSMLAESFEGRLTASEKQEALEGYETEKRATCSQGFASFVAPQSTAARTGLPLPPTLAASQQTPVCPPATSASLGRMANVHTASGVHQLPEDCVRKIINTARQQGKTPEEIVQLASRLRSHQLGVQLLVQQNADRRLEQARSVAQTSHAVEKNRVVQNITDKPVLLASGVGGLNREQPHQQPIMVRPRLLNSSSVRQLHSSAQSLTDTVPRGTISGTSSLFSTSSDRAHMQAGQKQVPLTQTSGYPGTSTSPNLSETTNHRLHQAVGRLQAVQSRLRHAFKLPGDGALVPQHLEFLQRLVQHSAPSPRQLNTTNLSSSSSSRSAPCSANICGASVLPRQISFSAVPRLPAVSTAAKQPAKCVTLEDDGLEIVTASSTGSVGTSNTTKEIGQPQHPVAIDDVVSPSDTQTNQQEGRETHCLGNTQMRSQAVT